MSQSLIWHIIRDNNSFMVKRERTNRAGSIQFSSEPGNLMNAHCFKYSGVANNRGVDISSTGLLRIKGGCKTANKPSKIFCAGEALSVHQKTKTMAKVVSLVSATRPDLLAAAKVRASKTLAGVRAKNANRAKKVCKSAKRGTK